MGGNTPQAIEMTGAQSPAHAVEQPEPKLSFRLTKQGKGAESKREEALKSWRLGADAVVTGRRVVRGGRGWILGEAGAGAGGCWSVWM